MFASCNFSFDKQLKKCYSDQPKKVDIYPNQNDRGIGYLYTHILYLLIFI